MDYPADWLDRATGAAYRFPRAWHPCLQVNKAADKYEKQMKAAKKSGSKAKQDKVGTCVDALLQPAVRQGLRAAGAATQNNCGRLLAIHIAPLSFSYLLKCHVVGSVYSSHLQCSPKQLQWPLC